MSRVVVVANNKGGVGKTTTVQALSVALVRRGRSVLMVDLESQHSLTALYGSAAYDATMAQVIGVGGQNGPLPIGDVIAETYQEGLHLAPAAAELVLSEEALALRDMRETVLHRILTTSRLPYDYVVVDTSPSLGFLLLNALVAADEVVVPMQPEPMAVRGFSGIYGFIKRARTVQEYGGALRLYLRAVLVTFFRHGHIVDEGALTSLRAARHPDYSDEMLPLAPSVVPETTLFRQATVVDQELDRAQTIFELAPDHPGAVAYVELAELIDG